MMKRSDQIHTTMGNKIVIVENTRCIIFSKKLIICLLCWSLLERRFFFSVKKKSSCCQALHSFIFHYNLPLCHGEYTTCLCWPKNGVIFFFQINSRGIQNPCNNTFLSRLQQDKCRINWKVSGRDKNI